MGGSEKIRVVVDTNVCIQWLISKSGRNDSILTACLKGQQFTLLYSGALLEELEDVITREKMRRWFTEEQGFDLIALIILMGEEIPSRLPEQLPRVCRDEKDNFLFAVYDDGEADVLVSGDKDVLEVSVPGVTVINPSQALALLQEEHEWGTHLIPEVIPGQARRAIEAAGNAKLYDAFGLFCECVTSINDGKYSIELLKKLTVPGTFDAWKRDFEEVFALVENRSFGSQPLVVSPEIMGIKLLPSIGETVLAVHDANNLTDIVIVTFERCPDVLIDGVDPVKVDGWRAHSIGRRVLSAGEVRPPEDSWRQGQAELIRNLFKE